jgi:Predicted periplasmic protein
MLILFHLKKYLAAVVFATSVFAMAAPVHADYQLSAQWFNGLSIDERADLQGNLVLLAHYGGLVDSRFGPGTYGAIVDWQSAIGAPRTGVLTTDQLGLLDQMASQAMSDLGVDLVEDLDGRLTVMLPMGLLPKRVPTPAGTRYEALNGNFTVETFWRAPVEGDLSSQLAQARAAPNTFVSYSALTADFYVVTGLVEGRYFYELVYKAIGGSAGFRFTYDEEHRRVGGVASVFAASYSAPTNLTITAAPEQTLSPYSGTESSSDGRFATTDEGRDKVVIPDGTPEKGVNVYGSFITFDSVPGLLALVGDIGPKTPLDMRRALHAMEKPTTVALVSDGGNVASALMVAYEVHELGLSTYVMPETGCYSACAFIFLAGRDRLVEGELGVHQVWGEDADASSAQTVVSDILEAFSEFGVRQEVTSAMLRTLPQEMYIFDHNELSAWGINTP